MTIRRELIINFSELGQMIVPCPKCETSVTIAVRAGVIPGECPSCGEEYEDLLREDLQAFRQIYRRFSDAKHRNVQFRIPSPDGKPE